MTQHDSTQHDDSPESGQTAIFAEETVTETETVPPTVWVVLSRGEGSPHPEVEAVYDNEEAAKKHKRDLADNAFQHGVVAWGLADLEVRSEFEGGENA